MLPNNPFDSNRGFNIRDLLEESAVNNIGSVDTIDQSVGRDGDKLVVTADVSQFDTSNIKLGLKEKQGYQILTIALAQNQGGFSSYQKQISLKENVSEENVEATENNGVLTIEFDIVENEDDETNIEIE